jgi:hypothetical protein
MATQVQELALTVADDLKKEGLSHTIVTTLSDSISQRASDLLTRYF